MTGIYYDTDADVAPGDYLHTRAGTRYLVLTVREVQRRDPQARRRLNLTLHRLHPHDHPDPDVPHHLIRWYQRQRKHTPT